MEMEPCKLFIGGISWDTNEDRLRDYFQTFGEVIEAVIMKDRSTGRARGFGFIVFADPAVAERVVTEKHLLDGRTVEAKKAVPRDDQNVLISRNISTINLSPSFAHHTKKIFVGGLASTVTESEFKKYFDHFGTITDLVVMYDHNTQRPRGFGFITFDSEEAVERVLYKTFHELHGKMVEVKRAVPKESSPGLSLSPSSSNQVSGYNCGLGRISTFLNGYNLSSVNDYAIKPEGRFSPITIGRNGFSPLNSPSYNMGLNFEDRLNTNYARNLNLGLNLVYGRALSPSLYSGHSSRYGGSSSPIGPSSQNLLGNGNYDRAVNPTNLRTSTTSLYGGVDSGMESMNSIAALWGSSLNLGGGNAASPTYHCSENINYGSGDVGPGLEGIIGYGRNSPGPNITSSSLFNDHEGNSFRLNTTWKLPPSELGRLDLYAYGIGNAASDATGQNTAGYSISNRQSNRGIAA